MVEVFKKSSGPNPVQREAYNDILKLYDAIEEFIKAAERHGEAAEPYIKDLKKLVTATEKNLDTVIDNFLNYMESGKGLQGIEKLKMEKGVKEIKLAFQEFFSKVETK